MGSSVEVDDLEELQARFAEQCVQGFAPHSMGWANVVEGHDPDGHGIIVYCFKRE